MSDQDQSFEERLRMFFAVVPDLVFRIRKDGTFLDFSPSTEFTTYVPPDRFLDEKIHDIMPADMADTITAGMDRALSLRSRETVEYHLEEPAGTRHYEARMVAVGKEEVVAIVRDITRAKEAEAELVASERRYRELVEDSQGLICTHDLDGKFTSVNPAAAESAGYSASEMVGMNLGDLVVERARHLFEPYLQRIREEGSDSGIILVNARGGEHRYWTYHNVLKTPASGDPYVLGHALDVTDLKHAERTAKRLELRRAAFYREAPFAIGRLDEDGTIVEGNRHLADLLGEKGLDGLVGRDLSAEAWVGRLIGGEKVVEVPVSFHDGGSARVTGWPLEDDHGTVSGAAFVAMVSKNAD